MEKVIAKKRLGDPSGDLAYWRTRTVEERLEALEALRQQTYGYDDETVPQMERVIHIIQRDTQGDPS